MEVQFLATQFCSRAWANQLRFWKQLGVTERNLPLSVQVRAQSLKILWLQHHTAIRGVIQSMPRSLQPMLRAVQLYRHKAMLCCCWSYQILLWLQKTVQTQQVQKLESLGLKDHLVAVHWSTTQLVGIKAPEYGLCWLLLPLRRLTTRLGWFQAQLTASPWSLTQYTDRARNRTHCQCRLLKCQISLLHQQQHFQDRTSSFPGVHLSIKGLRLLATEFTSANQT